MSRFYFCLIRLIDSHKLYLIETVGLYSNTTLHSIKAHFPCTKADANCLKCLSDIELILRFPGLNLFKSGSHPV